MTSTFRCLASWRMSSRVVGLQAHLRPGALGKPFCLGFESSSHVTYSPSDSGSAVGELLLHVLEQFAEQPGRFGLEGRGGAQPYPDGLRRAGEVGVQLADQPGDMAGGLVGEVGVSAEMVGDDLGGVLRAEPGRLEEHLRRQAEPFDDPPEVRQVGQVALLDSRERIERDVALVGRGAQAEA